MSFGRSSPDGFDSGDKAFHLVDPKRREDHLRRLAESGVDVEEAMASGQLEVHPWEDGPLHGERFDQDTWLAGFEEVLQSGRGSGYAKTRFLAQMEWALVDLPGIEDMVEFETRVNYIVPKYGTQQRLVSLEFELRAAEADVPPNDGDLRARLSRIRAGLAEAIADLREISRGIHPAILSQGGLDPALRTLARRSTISVELDVMTDMRLPEPVEVAAYYVASEALANATKHAQASRIEVSLALGNGSLLVSIRDDRLGGADPARGSGLLGLNRPRAGPGRVDPCQQSAGGWDTHHRRAAGRVTRSGSSIP